MPRPAKASAACSRVALLALLLVGCGGATFRNDVYDDGAVRYRIGELGPQWERVDAEGNDLAFFNKTLGMVAVNSTCTEYEDVPEEALLNHLLFGMRERVFRLEETVTVDGRGALHAIIDLELDGVPITLEVYLIKKDGCVYDLTLTASRAAFERARPALAQVVSRFSVLRTSLD